MFRKFVSKTYENDGEIAQIVEKYKVFLVNMTINTLDFMKSL